MYAQIYVYTYTCTKHNSLEIGSVWARQSSLDTIFRVLFELNVDNNFWHFNPQIKIPLWKNVEQGGIQKNVKSTVLLF